MTDRLLAAGVRMLPACCASGVLCQLLMVPATCVAAHACCVCLLCVSGAGHQLREHQGATGGDAPSSSGVQAAAAARDAGGSGRRQRRRQRGGGGAAAAAAGGAAEADAGGADGGGSRDGSGSQSGSEEDEEAEAELVAAVRSKSKEDPLAAYDMDVAEEGDAIQVGAASTGQTVSSAEHVVPSMWR